MDRKQAQVTAVSTGFDVDAAAERARVSRVNRSIIRDQKNPGLQQFPHLLEIDALTVQEEALRLAKPSVDNGGAFPPPPPFRFPYPQTPPPLRPPIPTTIQPIPLF